MKPVLAALLMALSSVVAAQAAEPLRVFPDARLIENGINDGDSFWIQSGATSMLVRLYFVDCPETSASFDAMAQRVKEQMRYFGLHDARTMMDFGRTAKQFTYAALERPFTVQTAFTPAGGASGVPRYYAFITTAEGKDFGGLLVEHGLARVRGFGRPTPDGSSQATRWDELRDLESAAMLKHAGLWAVADPDEIVAGRAAQRQEVEVLRQIGLESGTPPIGPVDINHASQESLELVNGIGPVTAASIIAGRPYTNVTDLARVRGVGRRGVEKLAAALCVGEQPRQP